MAYKNKFEPKNKAKYIGDPSKILCRSLWERKVCIFLDTNQSILKWAFEGTKIQYVSPVDGKVHNYIPDFLVQMVRNGKKINYIWEVKPKKQTMLKENAKQKEIAIFQINMAKWKAAEKFCKDNGFVFEIVTERQIFYGEQLGS